MVAGHQGFSFGVCHDTDVLTLEPVGTSGDFDEVVDWAPAVETLKQGGAPDFFQQNLESGGWTVGCVICFTSCDVLAPGTYEFCLFTAISELGKGMNFSGRGRLNIF